VLHKNKRRKNMENDMHYTSYGDIIDANVENVYRNGVASKILQHMDRIRNASDIRQARRWVMELLQNSRDVAYKDQQVRVKIELTDNYLIFSHNGMPFKVENILAIVNQVSSKIPSEDAVMKKEKQNLLHAGDGRI
jgi:hypothetical protein